MTTSSKISPSPQEMSSLPATRAADRLDPQLLRAHRDFTKPWWMARKAVNAGALQSCHRQGVAACSSAPPPDAGGDVDDVRLRLRALVDVAVPVQVEHVLREALAEAVEDRAQLRIAAVVARRVGRPVARR